MPKLPGISYAEAVRVFAKLGFRVVREGKHDYVEWPRATYHPKA